MPNGESKNWIRMCAAIDGYRLRYREWPKKIRFTKFFPEELKHLVTEEELRTLTSKIELIADGSEFIAEGDDNKSYNYGQEGFADNQTDTNFLTKMQKGENRRKNFSP